jgi:hypothetical protein
MSTDPLGFARCSSWLRSAFRGRNFLQPIAKVERGPSDVRMMLPPSRIDHVGEDKKIGAILTISASRRSGRSAQ